MRTDDRYPLSAPLAATACPPALDVDRLGRVMLDAANVGLAVTDPDTLEVRAMNARMREWFGEPGRASGRLDALLPGLDADDLGACIAAGRTYQFETGLRHGRRTLKLAIRIGDEDVDGAPALFVECQNVSKLHELEYMLQSYAAMVEKQNRDLAAAKERVERVLLNIMPKTVYEEWRRFGVTTPRVYENATVLMLDFVGFTEMAVTGDPPALIAELNDIFTGFDRIVEQFGSERLKTIGDAYMAVSGLPVETPDHAANIAGVALRIRRFLEMRNAAHANTWRCRIGIHSGPVVGSIVGVQKYVYDIFGPGVNTAARLEALAEPMEILLSGDTRSRLDSRHQVRFLRTHTLRGAGETEVYALDGADDL